MSLRVSHRMNGIERTLIRRIFDAAPPDAINLGLGQPDLPTPEGVRLAGIRAIAQGRTGYTSTGGDPELRRAVAERYPSLARSAASVAITVGSQEACFLAFLVLLDPGDEVLIPDPGYPGYAAAARLVGATVRSYSLRPERGFHLDATDVETALGPKTRLVVVCSPSNPTGSVERREDLSRLAGVLKARGVAWLSDEIYSGFVYGSEFSSLADIWPEGGLVISGLSKDLSMTGWRIGWVAGPESVISRIVAAHQYLVTCAPSISQWAALAAFGEAGEAERRRLLGRFGERRCSMESALRRIPGVHVNAPEGAFYFFLDVRSFGPSLGIADRLLEEWKVITIPGEAFGPGGEGFLRLSFAASETDIERGVDALAKVLAASRRSV